MWELETPSPLLRLPLEIRLMIYEHLFQSPTSTTLSGKALSAVSYYDYERKQAGGLCIPPNTLAFRTDIQDSVSLSTLTGSRKRRSTYKIRDRFRNRCVDATYTCVNVPSNLDTCILATNRQIYLEAAPVLYGFYSFDFDTNVEACVSFLNDLTPYSRSCIRKISVVKRALPYDKDFDRCEWTNMCAYISAHMALTDLSLGVVSGMPLGGWGDVLPLPENVIDSVVQRYKRDEMQRVRDLMTIRGLQQLQVWACIEHCPPPMSEAMRFFVEFSASVDEGFASYLMKRMIQSKAC